MFGWRGNGIETYGNRKAERNAIPAHLHRLTTLQHREFMQ